MLKRQTVWLLTMLSLVVVLSVYYVTTSDKQRADMVSNPLDKLAKQTTDKNTANKEKSSGDEQFAQYRLDAEDKRSEVKEKLQNDMVSVNTSAEEKSKAKDKFDQLNKVSTKETLVETLIKSKGYKDALVRAEGDNVRITVKASKYTAKDANQIMQLVKSEMGGALVTVQFDPAK